ncbi:MAG: hypothetical protein J6O49_15910 [Bacteroidaceae bacterium]|nr:hypothetical protein [Bacteroidaceae bacterium]
MDYRVTVFLPSNFEKSEYLPHLKKRGKELAQMGGRVCWASDQVDFDALTKAYENREITWFGISPVPKTYPKKWISHHNSTAPMNLSSMYQNMEKCMKLSQKSKNSPTKDGFLG